MPGGDKLRRVFFCLLRNREVRLAGRDLVVLKWDRRSPTVVMARHMLAFCTLHYASHRTTENAIRYSDKVYGFGK